MNIFDLLKSFGVGLVLLLLAAGIFYVLLITNIALYIVLLGILFVACYASILIGTIARGILR